MGINRTVFSSRPERDNYQKLCRTWSSRLRIYHNLPFLNVFNTAQLFDWKSRDHAVPITLNGQDLARLKKTSIDYTLCEDNDAPVLCIEFDGLQEGFNVGADYHPAPHRPPPDPWRQAITELKLRVALGSNFPYFVVGYRHFEDLTPDVKLTIVDGVVGAILAERARRRAFAETEFDTEQLFGLSRAEFDDLPPDERQDLVQDWGIGVEVQTAIDNNPISQYESRLHVELLRLGLKSWSHESLVYPPLDLHAPLEERGRQLDAALMFGARVTLDHSVDVRGVTATAWLPNFDVAGFSAGFGLCQELAFIAAGERLKRLLGAPTASQPRGGANGG